MQLKYSNWSFFAKNTLAVIRQFQRWENLVRCNCPITSNWNLFKLVLQQGKINNQRGLYCIEYRESFCFDLVFKSFTSLRHAFLVENQFKYGTKWHDMKFWKLDLIYWRFHLFYYVKVSMFWIVNTLST